MLNLKKIVLSLGIISSTTIIIWISYRRSFKMQFPDLKQDLKNIRVIITGSTSGIGKSIAIGCARRGANVVLASRNLNKMEQVKCEIRNKIPVTNIDCVSDDNLIYN